MSKLARAVRRIPALTLFLVGIILAVGGLLVVTSGDSPPPLPAPAWSGIFGSDGRVIDLHGGLDAAFTSEKVSRGVGIDNSILTDAADASSVDNGTVAPEDDLGNAYFWATRNAAGDTLLYAGVERLFSTAGTFVEFEFNQGVVKVTVGAPWPIHGKRTVDDLLVRLNFKDGAINSAEFKRWDGQTYQTLLTGGPDGCAGVDYRYCAGTPPLQSSQDETWDATGHTLTPEAPDAFAEIGVNLRSVLGSNVEFTSIQVRTPHDVVLDSFHRIGHWAHAGQGGGQ